MNIQNLTEKLINAGIEQNEAKYEIKMMLEHYFNYRELDKLKGKTLTEEQTSFLEQKILYRINTKTPIQYILGKAYFMGEYYKVTSDVLIPRDETEILTRKAIEIINNNNLHSVLDIGTGSGCIACTIAKNTSSTVLGIDISTAALRIALDNVSSLGINNKAVFRKSDLYSNIRDDEKFDVIISNPPYIPEGTVLSEEVQHEPGLALYAKENGLEFYNKIIKHAHKFLNSNGYLLLELGLNESSEVKKLMNHSFCETEIIKDLAGIDRVIFGKLIK